LKTFFLLILVEFIIIELLLNIIENIFNHNNLSTRFSIFKSRRVENCELEIRI